MKTHTKKITLSTRNTNGIKITTTQINYDSATGEELERVETPASYRFEICTTSTRKVFATVEINFELLRLSLSNISNVMLYLYQYTSYAQKLFLINNMARYENDTAFAIPLFPLISRGIARFTIEAAPELGTRSAIFDILGRSAPKVEIEYKNDYCNEKPVRESVPLVGDSNAHIDLLSGEAIVTVPTVSDNNMGINVSHVLRYGEDGFCCGMDAKLSLNESLKKVENELVYTDSMGDTHTFTEKFYYINDGERVNISKNNITVSTNGDLSFINDSKKYKVYREEYTESGLKAFSRLEGGKNLESYMSDIKEEELKAKCTSLAEAISSYNIYNTDGSIFAETTTAHSDISEFKNSLDNMTSEQYVLSKGEALNINSTLVQKRATEVSIASLKNSINSLKLQRLLLEKQGETTSESIEMLQKRSCLNWMHYRYLRAEIDRLQDNTTDSNDELRGKYSEEADRMAIYNANGVHESTFPNLVNVTSYSEVNAAGNFILTCTEAASLRAYRRTENPYVTVTETDENGNTISTPYYQATNIDKQLELAEAQLLQANDQLALLNKQLEILETASDNAKEKLNSYFMQYTEAYKQFIVQYPVSFIYEEHLIKGFNQNGDLVVVYEKNGNYIAIEYEAYYYGSETKYRIACVYDNKSRKIRFNYDDSDLLCEIVDSLGKTTAFKYNSNGHLSKITYPNAYSISIASGSNCIISDSYGFACTLDYKSTHKVMSISKETSVEKVSHNNVTSSNTNTKLQEISFEYEMWSTSVMDIRNKYAKEYCFSSSTHRCTQFIQKEQDLITIAEQYSYKPFGYVDVTAVNTEALKTEAVTFDNVYTREVTLDSYNKPVRIVETDKTVNILASGVKVKQTTTVDYTYNKNEQITKIEGCVNLIQEGSSSPFSSKTYVQLIEYNDLGDVSRTQSYVEGEEGTSGIDIEEHVYDKNGFEIRTVTYNSLDPSSKLYAEKEYDENGQVRYQLDPTGRYRTGFEYENGSVSTKVFPNGSKLSYGYSDLGSSSAITMSTKDGEENSIQVYRTNGLVTKVKADGDLWYGYQYDAKGRMLYSTLCGLTLARAEYNDAYTTKTSIINNNSGQVKTTKDLLGKVLSVEKTVNNVTTSIVNTYDEKQRLKTVTESEGNSTVTYGYDDLDRPVSCYKSDNCNESVTYDNYGKVSEKVSNTTSGTTTYNYTYTNDSKKTLSKIKLVEDNITITPKIDCLGRNTGKTIGSAVNDTISYLKLGNRATNIPVSVKYVDNSHIRYKYDRMGNICAVYENDILVVEYEYDKLNRLARENNRLLNKTVLFRYDNRGNMLSRTEYAYTRKNNDELQEIDGNVIKYTYYPFDRLISCGNYTFVASIIGIPTEHKGNSVVFEGDKMAQYGNCFFTYDAFGRRTAKRDSRTSEVSTINFNYDVNGSLVSQSNGISFIYDHNSLIGFKYSDTKYFYRKDILGNIIAIVDTSGNVVVKYVYDAWGNHKVLSPDGTENTDSTFIGNINPYRYRGYYYDTETGLYFLQARYYDPEICRFISMDDVTYIDPETIGGLNLFAYCNNNPVMNVDPYGNSFLAAMLITAGVLILGGGAVGGIAAASTGGTSTDIWAGIGKGMLAGTILFAGVALTVGSFYVPGGVLGNLGLSMFTTGVGTIFDMLEISIYQGRKSNIDGDNFWEGTNDVINALYGNLQGVILGKNAIFGLVIYGSNIFSGISDATGFFDFVYELSSNWKYSKAFKIGMQEYWSSHANGFGYFMAIYGFASSIKSIARAITTDPNDSGFVLY